MRVIGIDPGLRRTGWGIMDAEGSLIRHVANGVCESAGDDLAERLLSLHVALTAVLRAWRPEAAAVEQTFVNKDAAGTLKLGQARGDRAARPGAGRAAGRRVRAERGQEGRGRRRPRREAQVAHMVRLQLPGVALAGPDATDALAIALCHLHHARFRDRLAAAIGEAGGMAA